MCHYRTEADQLARSLQTLDLLQLKVKKLQEQEHKQQKQQQNTANDSGNNSDIAASSALYQHVLEQEELLAERLKTKTVSTLSLLCVLENEAHFRTNLTEIFR